MIDRFREIFRRQKHLMDYIRSHTNDKIPVENSDITNPNVQVFCKDIISRCQDELWEAKYLLKNAKTHRANQDTDFDRDHFVEEMVDALHYFVELLIVAGVSDDEFYKAYLRKNSVNYNRVKNEFVSNGAKENPNHPQ